MGGVWDKKFSSNFRTKTSSSRTTFVRKFDKSESASDKRMLFKFDKHVVVATDQGNKRLTWVRVVNVKYRTIYTRWSSNAGNSFLIGRGVASIALCVHRISNFVLSVIDERRKFQCESNTIIFFEHEISLLSCLFGFERTTKIFKSRTRKCPSIPNPALFDLENCWLNDTRPLTHGHAGFFIIFNLRLQFKRYESLHFIIVNTWLWWWSQLMRFF